MDVQSFLVKKFSHWRPAAPAVVARTKGDITLRWMDEEPFGFLGDQLLYRVEKREKIPRWVVVYSGGKTMKMIDNLAPRSPHRFRLKVILKSTAVPRLADLALAHFGDRTTIYEKMERINAVGEEEIVGVKSTQIQSETDNSCPETAIDLDIKYGTKDSPEVESSKEDTVEQNHKIPVDGDRQSQCNDCDSKDNFERAPVPAARATSHKWLESQWSEETWTSTDTDGSSPVCFCMAVRCGYLKQIQVMLDERPELIGIINPTNGFTPLAVAVRKGEISTVKFLLNAGADVEQPSATGQVALHLALLAGNVPVAELLLDRGADIGARDCNGLRAEHYAVEGGAPRALRLVLARGGRLAARDLAGWTPLFRAVCQGASTEMIEELVAGGSDVELRDHAGLPLATVARLLRNSGRGRPSVLRLVDAQYPHEKALENFTRLSKKIYNVHSLLKLP